MGPNYIIPPGDQCDERNFLYKVYRDTRMRIPWVPALYAAHTLHSVIYNKSHSTSRSGTKTRYIQGTLHCLNLYGERNSTKKTQPGVNFKHLVINIINDHRDRAIYGPDLCPNTQAPTMRRNYNLCNPYRILIISRVIVSANKDYWLKELYSRCKAVGYVTNL